MAGEIRLLKFRNKATTLRSAEILILILLIRSCEGVKKRVPYTNQDDLQRPLSHHHHGGISKKQVSKDFRSILPGCSDLKLLERGPRTPQVILISVRNFLGTLSLRLLKGIYFQLSDFCVISASSISFL